MMYGGQYMADLVPIILFSFGLVAALKPDWVAAIDRRQKAAGTARRPEDVEMSDGYYALVRGVGTVLVLFGAVFTLRSL